LLPQCPAPNQNRQAKEKEHALTGVLQLLTRTREEEAKKQRGLERPTGECRHT
jgi:hypothetical protein